MAKLKFLDGVKRRIKSIRNPVKSFKAASTPRKFLFGLGTISFIAGVTLLGFGLISALSSGDNLPDDSAIVEVKVTPSPEPTLRITSTPSPTPVPTPPLTGSYEMVINKIGVDAPVQEYGLDAQAIPQVPTGPDAASIVAWYNFSSKPGTGSNAVFAGHVTWNGVAVFYNLSSLAAGDQIVLKGADGTVVNYVVSDVFSVDPTTDPHAKDVMLPTPTDVLTIITCGGDFVRNPNDHVFGGDYNHRLVIRANLQSVSPAAANAAAGAG